MRATVVVVCLVVASTAVAHADDIDVQQQAYVDVLETADGSSWVGALVEEVPGDHYKLVMADGSVRVIKAADVVKITKRKNPAHVLPAAMPAAAPIAMLTCAPAGASVAATAAPLPPVYAGSYARSGLRVSASVDMIFPVDDISGYDTSYAPDVRVGFEQVFGRISLAGGGLVRWTYWQLPTLPDIGPNHDAAWTLETHVYAQAAYHLDRLSLVAGTSLGLDSNYLNVDTGGMYMSKTSAGFGMNLFGGFELDYLPNVALSFMFDYHPPTATIVSGAPGSVSYLAATAGAIVRL